MNLLIIRLNGTRTRCARLQPQLHPSWLPVPVWAPLASVPPATTRGSKARIGCIQAHTHPMRYRDVMQFTCSIVSFYRRSTLGPGMLPIPTASLTMLHERDAIIVVVADERLSAAVQLH